MIVNLTCEIRIEDNNLFIDDELISENCATTQDIGNLITQHFERLKIKAKILKNIYSPSFEIPFDKKKIKVNINHNFNNDKLIGYKGEVLSLELVDNYDKQITLLISLKEFHCEFLVSIFIEDFLVIKEEILKSNELVSAVLEAINLLADLQ